MTTDAVSGLTVTLTVDGEAVGAAKGYTLSGSQAMIDATSDDSSRWGEYIVGRRDVTIDIDCLYIYNDQAQIYIDEHFFEGVPAALSLILTFPDGRTYTGEALVTSLTYNRNFEDVITAAVTLQITDGITTTTS